MGLGNGCVIMISNYFSYKIQNAKLDDIASQAMKILTQTNSLSACTIYCDSSVNAITRFFKGALGFTLDGPYFEVSSIPCYSIFSYIKIEVCIYVLYGRF